MAPEAKPGNDGDQGTPQPEEPVSPQRTPEEDRELRELIAGATHGPKRWHAVLLLILGLLLSIGLLIAGYKAGAFR